MDGLAFLPNRLPCQDFVRQAGLESLEYLQTYFMLDIRSKTDIGQYLWQIFFAMIMRKDRFFPPNYILNLQRENETAQFQIPSIKLHLPSSQSCVFAIKEEKLCGLLS